MKKYLVAGGAGFIGSNFIRHLLCELGDIKVVNLDVLTYAGSEDNLSDISSDSRYFFVRGDISDQKLTERLFAEHDFDFVVNFAAQTHVDRSIADPGIFMRTNALGAQSLMEQARRSWTMGVDEAGRPLFKPGARFLQISTDEVYGSADDGQKFTESSPLRPNNPYSASKAAADLTARAYFVTYGFPVIITRCANNYGEHQYLEKFIPLMIKNALENRELPIYGDGKQLRDWIYAPDHCKALDLVLHNGKEGEIYNIGADNPMQNIRVAQMILDLTNRPHSLIAHVTDRLGHDRQYLLDTEKIKRELAWRAETDFEHGLDMTVDYYRNKFKL